MSSRKSPGRLRGFSLLELLVAMAVLAIVGAMASSLLDSVRRVSRQTIAHAEQFRESRRAFERINQRLSQATLNTYHDYINSSGQPRTTNNAATFAPRGYARISELRYLQTSASNFPAPRGGAMRGQAVFFQAPSGKSDSAALAGLNTLLNTVGFYIEKGVDANLRPPTVTATSDRFRLFEMVEPTENLTVYSRTSGSAGYSGTEWASVPLANTNYSHRLADNIVALVFRAIYQAANGSWQTNAQYSSAPRGQSTHTQPIEENNLPPQVALAMVAVDDASARRIAETGLELIEANSIEDIGRLEKQLGENNLAYRRFESVVPIGAAKWSTK